LKHRRQADGHVTVVVGVEQVAAVDQIQCHAWVSNAAGGTNSLKPKAVARAFAAAEVGENGIPLDLASSQKAVHRSC
jgi:hypothetical protein